MARLELKRPAVESSNSQCRAKLTISVFSIVALLLQAGKTISMLETSSSPRLFIGRKATCILQEESHSPTFLDLKIACSCVLRSERFVLQTLSCICISCYSYLNMPSVEVTAVVASIVSAFASGMDIFKRMKAKQRPKRSSQKPYRMTEEEWQLQSSLQHRPREIRAEYDRNLVRFGSRFAIGDSTAQTSLNHTLLILNTGLIQILSHALSNDTKAQALSRRSLLELSEAAAADALQALELLQSRLSSTPQLTLTAPPSPDKKARGKGEEASKGAVSSKKTRPAHKPRSKPFSITERKRPGPDPLVRGAWVRSKSGTSVITASSSSSETITPKVFDLKAKSASLVPYDMSLPHLSYHRTKSSPSHSSRPNHDRSLDIPREDNFSYLDQSTPSYVTFPEQRQHHFPNRQPSLLLASPEVFNDPQTTPLQSPARPPPPPPKIPLQTSSPSHNTRLLPVHIRPRPPSVATFLTASTKIGEIPEHRWVNHHNNHDNSSPARPPLPWEKYQHHQQPLPYTIPPRLEDEPSPKRKGKGFRFWKRSE